MELLNLLFFDLIALQDHERVILLHFLIAKWLRRLVPLVCNPVTMGELRSCNFARYLLFDYLLLCIWVVLFIRELERKARGFGRGGALILQSGIRCLVALLVQVQVTSPPMLGDDTVYLGRRHDWWAMLHLRKFHSILGLWLRIRVIEALPGAEGLDHDLMLPVLVLLNLIQLLCNDLDVLIRLVQQRVEEVHFSAH